MTFKLSNYDLSEVARMKRKHVVDEDANNIKVRSALLRPPFACSGAKHRVWSDEISPCCSPLVL